MQDQNIESKCTGFSFELKKEKPINYVKNLLVDSGAAHFGLNIDDIQNYKSVTTLFHVKLSEGAKNTKSLDEVFNFAANFAVGNATVIKFIEPTFETVIPPARTTESFMTNGVTNLIRDWFKRVLGKRTEEDEVFDRAVENKNWPSKMLQITQELKTYLKGRTDVYKDKIIVAHPDTGYMLHPDIVPNVEEKLSRNFVKPKQEGEPGYSDGSTHGTATASIIIGKEYGVANEEAMIVPLRTHKSAVYFSWSALEQGLDYAIKLNTCHVISMSLGGPIKSNTVMRLIDAAIEKGIIVLAAAGNYTGSWVVFPANYEPVIAVAACGDNFQLWENSAFGKAVSVTAPGYGVFRATMDNNEPIYAPSSGTSYAVAHVAGLAVLWMKYYGHRIEPRLRQQTFKNLLRDSNLCTPVQGGKSGTFGGGIANAEKLLRPVLGREALVVANEMPQAMDSKEAKNRTGLVMLPEYYEKEVEDIRGHIRKNNPNIPQLGYVRELELGYRMISDPKFQQVVDDHFNRIRATRRLESTVSNAAPMKNRSLREEMLDRAEIPETFKEAIL